MSRMTAICQALVERYGIDMHEAEEFVTELFTFIRDNIDREKIIKVKGLGTFKLTEMNARESVDISTGERILIEGRQKLTFTPENAVRDRINSPFSQFESIDIDDDSDFASIDEKYDVAEDSERTDSERSDTAALPSSVPTKSSVVDEEDANDAIPAVNTDTVGSEQSGNISAGNSVDMAIGSDHGSDGSQSSEHVEKSAESVAVDSVSAADVRSAETQPEENAAAEMELLAKPADTSENGSSVSASSVHETESGHISDADARHVSPTASVRAPYCEGLIREEISHSRRIIRLLYAVLSLLGVAVLFGAAYVGYKVGTDTWYRDHLLRTVHVETPRVEKQKPVAKPMAKPMNSTKPEAKADSVKVKMPVDSFAIMQRIYNKDVRVRTGAYAIVGLSTIVKVQKGQTLHGISKAYLGEGMECYVEVYNNGIKEVNVGDSIRIPKLKLKKRLKR